MLVEFVYFFSREVLNISENTEILTNEVLKFLLKEKEYIKLKEYPSYDFIKNNLGFDDTFDDFEFKNRGREEMMLNNPDLYFQTSATFFDDSYYIVVRIPERHIKILGEKNDIIEQKIIDFNKKIIEKYSNIEASIYFHGYGLPTYYDFPLTKTKNNTQEVKEWITNMFFRKGEKIYFEKGDLDIYGKNRITGY